MDDLAPVVTLLLLGIFCTLLAMTIYVHTLTNIAVKRYNERRTKILHLKEEVNNLRVRNIQRTEELVRLKRRLGQYE